MNPERVGRDGFLRLRFACRGAKTILAASRFSLPLQALTPLALDGGACHLMLLNPTGGVLGGDRLITEIVLEPGTHVCLTTPSATRVYRTSNRPAVLETVIRVEENATLEYVPDHVIPHAGAALRQSLRVEMARGSRAVLLDAMASGRKAHGERWKFSEILSHTDVRVCGKPAYVSRTKIAPAGHSPARIGVMQDFDYTTSLSVISDEFPAWPEVCAALNAKIDSSPQLQGGASALARYGCVARFLASSAPDMTLANQQLWDLARNLVLHLPPLDQRKY